MRPYNNTYERQKEHTSPITQHLKSLNKENFKITEQNSYTRHSHCIPCQYNFTKIDDEYIYNSDKLIINRVLKQNEFTL